MSSRHLALALCFPVCVWPQVLTAASAKDTPFLQDRSVQFTTKADVQGARFIRLAVERKGIVDVLTDRGVARLFDGMLALDRSFRPLADQKPRDITVGPNGRLYYLLKDCWLSKGNAGKPLPEGGPE